MICTHCYEKEYQLSKTDMKVNINDEPHILRDLACEICPACGDTTFTHAQSLEIDKRRIALEFGLKPQLTPEQLKVLRQILNIKLEDICELLHIGRNTYGRWERGEVAITPSMNLLVHGLIDKIPDARVNLMDAERIAAIEKANARILADNISFGEYIREVIAATKLLPDIVCSLLGIEVSDLSKIQNNELLPEKIPFEITAKIAIFFRLSRDVISRLLNSALTVITMKNTVTAVHARSTCYNGKEIAMQTSSINKILEKLAQKNGAIPTQQQISNEYLEKVFEAMARINSAEV